MVLYLPIY